MKRKSLAILAAIAAAASLTACGISTAKLYEGAELPASQQAVLSTMGIYRDRRLVLQVMAVDGKEIDPLRTSEILLKPGKRHIKLAATKDLEFSMGAGLITQTGKGATLELPLNALAGHTYIPNAVINGDRIRAYFDDTGLGFKRECMPLRRYAIAYGGSVDGKKPGC